MALYVLQAFFNHIQPTEIGFQVHDGFVQQQDMSQFDRGVGALALGGDAVELTVQCGALNLDDTERLPIAGGDTQHQLDEELVAQVVIDDAGGKPIL